MEGRIAVGSVVLNRVELSKWDGETIHEVIMCPSQFSWLNSKPPQKRTDSQYERCVEIAKDWVERDNPGLDICLDIAEGMLDGKIKRNVSSVNYHALSVHPKWADKMVLERIIGNHKFYREIALISDEANWPKYEDIVLKGYKRED